MGSYERICEMKYIGQILICAAFFSWGFADFLLGSRNGLFIDLLTMFGGLMLGWVLVLVVREDRNKG